MGTALGNGRRPENGREFYRRPTIATTPVARAAGTAGNLRNLFYMKALRRNWSNIRGRDILSPSRVSARINRPAHIIGPR
jgi:hypothetical protein